MMNATKGMSTQMKSAEWEEAAELGMSLEAISVDILKSVIEASSNRSDYTAPGLYHRQCWISYLAGVYSRIAANWI